MDRLKDDRGGSPVGQASPTSLHLSALLALRKPVGGSPCERGRAGGVWPRSFSTAPCPALSPQGTWDLAPSVCLQRAACPLGRSSSSLCRPPPHPTAQTHGAEAKHEDGDPGAFSAETEAELTCAPSAHQLFHFSAIFPVRALLSPTWPGSGCSVSSRREPARETVHPLWGC